MQLDEIKAKEDTFLDQDFQDDFLNGMKVSQIEDI